jgi:nitrogen fixation NifU-like protein
MWAMADDISAITGIATMKASSSLMDRQEAIEFLVDHYQNPRHRGPLADADIHQTGGNPGCADKVTMYARVTPDGQVEEVSFEGEGCTISMAAASYVTEMVQGMTLEEVEHLSFETLIDDLGREVVMARPTCATVALGTLKQGVHELRMRRLAGQAQQ